ncbi:porin family protein [Tunicatimonas pelagia]|uniref:porin family protein n=1 Tax=Tunicatimonas pelagia TaxID=931531 RepID=UPI00266640FC|nr:porin family protein [Tunicatimonas pelagia]WKN46205.1 porin family protein [Tunicatimonas pelagia]
MKPRYKKIIIGFIALLLCALVIPISLMAQDARTGIKGGFNVSNLYIDNVSDENLRPGFHIGVFTQLPVSEFFAIQPEIMYSTKGASATYNDDLIDLEGEYSFNLNYVDVPILATFRLGESAEIHIGPYVSYLTNANISSEGSIDESANLDRDNFSTIDYGLSAGFQLNFNAISVGTRYNYGLNQVADSDAAEAILGDARNSLAQIYMTFNLTN